jgi:hypothetical protein
MNIHRLLVVGAAPLALVMLTGCPNPNTYGTPRTIAPGKVQIVASLEGVGLSDTQVTTTPAANGTTTQTVPYSFYAPTLPSVGVRVGVADSVDLGFRFADLSSLGVDGKFNFLRSRVFDMAVDPGVQGAYISAGGDSLGLFYFNLPLLLGINFSRALSLVLTPGFTYLLATTSVAAGGTSSAVVSGSAPLARFGVGLNIRIGQRFAIQPEVTALRGFDAEEPTYWNFGLGFVIGTSKDSMPDYSDVP